MSENLYGDWTGYTDPSYSGGGLLSAPAKTYADVEYNGTEMPTSSSGGGDALFTYYTPQQNTATQFSSPQVDYSIGNYGTGDAGNPIGGGGVAFSLGDIFDKMTSTFSKENDPTGKKGAAAISIGGPAIFKMLSELMTGAEKKKMKQSQQVADAATMNAQTNANAVNLKQQNLNASQISGTTFGAKPKGLLYQPASFDARQKRAGYQGV